MELQVKGWSKLVKIIRKSIRCNDDIIGKLSQMIEYLLYVLSA